MNNFLYSLTGLLITFTSFFSTTVAVQSGNNLTVEITGLHNSKGYVLLSLYNQKDGFPSNPAKAYLKDKTSIKDGKALFVYKALPAGTYAIAVLHDENENSKMDTKFLGLPKEGYGFSRDPTLYFGPPSFKSASFQHGPEQRVQISIKY